MGMITITAQGVAEPRAIVIKSVRRAWDPKAPMKLYEKDGKTLTTGEESAFYPDLKTALDKAFEEVRATVCA